MATTHFYDPKLHKRDIKAALTSNAHGRTIRASPKMTTQLLATELANLIQESKRKHSDLRQVCTFYAVALLLAVQGFLFAHKVLN